MRVATVFSGIGAVEHALQRMNIDHKIVFACDNGDVDVLSKHIDSSIIAIENEIEELKELIKTKKTEEYNSSITQAKQELQATIDELEYLDVPEALIIEILGDYTASEFINNNQKKAYSAIQVKLNSSEGVSKKHELMKLAIKLESDIKRAITNKSSFQKTIKDLPDYVTTYKNPVKAIRLLSEHLSMIHERINTESIRQKVFSIDNLAEEKQLVDEFYRGSETKNKVKQSYMANYKIEEEDFHWNVSFLNGKHYKEEVDLFVGGSPCQSFSLVGKQRGLDDTKGTLFYEYARLIEEIKPKVFIYENVKAVLSNDSGETWKTMTTIFEQLGYQWSYQILNAKDYGIPQNRERVFVVGFRKDLKVKGFEFPKPIPLTKTMQDFLLDNVSGKYYLPTKGIDFVTAEKNLTKRYTQIDGDIQLCQKRNQQFNWHGDFVFEVDDKEKEKTIEDLEKYFLSDKVKKYVLATGTKGFYSRPETDLEVARPLLQSMHKMHRAGVDNYVTTDGRLRKLTPRECLRLMGFCDSFKMVVADTSGYQQSGNSIVVDVLMQILKSIEEVYPALFTQGEG